MRGYAVMQVILFVFWGVLSLVLASCSSILLPSSDKALTVNQLPSMCTTDIQNITQASTIYYVKTVKESKVIKQCKFKASNVYFSSTAWNQLNKILSNFDATTRITPQFNKHPTSVEKFSIHTFILIGHTINHPETEYRAILAFDDRRGTWEAPPILDALVSNTSLFQLME